MSGLFPETSATLIRDLRGGPEAAGWGRFVAAYRTGIYRACRAAHLDDASAEDITQTVLMKMVANLDRYDPGRPFRPWLNEIIRNALLDHWNSAWVRRARLAPDQDEVLRDKLAESIASELGSDERLAIHVAIDRVRAEVRELDWQVFQRRHLLNQSVDEVAAELCITKPNVGVIASRFRARLKQLLEGMNPSA
jgi:RNA polymerase sigma-70 factor (ECF subfamily)